MIPRSVYVVCWLLGCAIAWTEGWALAWVIVGMGLGRYGANVQWHVRVALAEREREWGTR